MKKKILKSAMSVFACAAMLTCSIGASASETYISGIDSVVRYETVEQLYREGTNLTAKSNSSSNITYTVDSGVIDITLDGGERPGIELDRNGNVGGFTFLNEKNTGDYLCFDVKFDEGLPKEMLVLITGYYNDGNPIVDWGLGSGNWDMDVTSYGTLNSDGYYEVKYPLSELMAGVDVSKTIGDTVYLNLKAGIDWNQTGDTSGKHMYLKNIEIKKKTTIEGDTALEYVPKHILYDNGLECGVTASAVGGSALSTDSGALKATVTQSGMGIELDTTGREQIFDKNDQSDVFISANVKVSGVSGLIDAVLLYSTEGAEDSEVSCPINIVNDGTALADGYYNVKILVSNFTEDATYKWPQYSKIRFLSESTEIESDAYICVNDVSIGSAGVQSSTDVIWNAYDGEYKLSNPDTLNIHGGSVSTESDGCLKATVAGCKGISFTGTNSGQPNDRIGLTEENFNNAYLCFSVKYEGAVPEAMRAILWKDAWYDSSSGTPGQYNIVGAWDYTINNTNKWQNIRVPLRNYRNGCAGGELPWIKGARIEPAGDSSVEYTMYLDNVRIEIVNENAFRSDISLQDSTMTQEINSIANGTTINAVADYNNRLEGRAVPFTFVVAVYENDTLVDCYVQSTTAAPNTKGQLKQELNISTTAENCEVKAMLWESLDDIRPLTQFVNAYVAK